MTPKYQFILGSAPELSKAELDAVGIQNFNDPRVLIKRLGGVVKIVEVLPEGVNLAKVINGDFGVSDLTGKINIQRLCKSIKQKTGYRYVLPKQGSRQLSTVVVSKQKLTEIVFGDGWIGKTVAVQDFEDWNRRDYERPEINPQVGMLPPKIARIMCNLAISGINSQELTILDPFCGVGTILMESLMLGCRALGQDINPKQVEKTRKNLAWLVKTYNLDPKYDVKSQDARKISFSGKIDAIVTEVDLGPPVRASNLANVKKNLHALYLDCFRNWKRSTQKVVIALPDVEIVDKIIDMGYILEAGPFVYGRPQARVKRHILIFRNGAR